MMMGDRSLAERLADARSALQIQAQLIERQSADIEAAETAAFDRGVSVAKSTLAEWAPHSDVCRAIIRAQRDRIVAMVRADAERTECESTRNWLRYTADRIEVEQ